MISIHAPREGSDSPSCRPRPRARRNFYPRSPRGERPVASNTWMWSRLFLSTLPARGATSFCGVFPGKSRFLSTLPARGATSWSSVMGSTCTPFLSTLPARGATSRKRSSISIWPDFYPRSPRGERRADRGFTIRYGKFLSTLPARGATQTAAEQAIDTAISIHAPREGSDLPSRCPAPDSSDFYPRSPRGERPQGGGFVQAHGRISIHAPREGSDHALLVDF